MRRSTVLGVIVLTFVAGCGSNGEHGHAAQTSTTSARATVTSTAPATTMPFVTTPSSVGSSTANSAASGSILMLKVQVGDLNKAEDFYHTVFGATSAAEMGANVHIMTFPQGGPGLVLLHGDDKSKQGAFIMKVADLQATKNLAVANGATEQGTFAGSPGGQAAKSIDLLDPWGNNVEILQLG